MKLKWQQAPVKTQWGDEMAVASVAIDNDHTLSLYCERDQVPKVDAMFAQRQARSANTWVHATTWRRLTDEDLEAEFGFIDELLRDCCYRIEAKLKEKNSD